MLIVMCFLSCISSGKRVISPVKTKVPAIFEEISPKTQVFSINPEAEQQIKTKHGSIITFPKDSFNLPYYYKKGTLVQIEYKEFNYTPDFLSTGYSLSLMEKNSPKSLESAGMFEIKASYENSEINLNKKISIKIPNNNPGKDYNLYKIENNEWIYSGSNSQIAQASTRTDLPYEINEGKRISYSKAETLFREFNSIDKLTIWNFDIPIDNTCLSINLKSLSINESNLLFYSVFSTSKLRVNFKWNSSSNLNIMVPTDDTINILFWFENKLSIIKGIRTPSAPLGQGKLPTPENCLDKGEQILEFQPEELFKDQIHRNKFLF